MQRSTGHRDSCCDPVGQTRSTGQTRTWRGRDTSPEGADIAGSARHHKLYNTRNFLPKAILSVSDSVSLFSKICAQHQPWTPSSTSLSRDFLSSDSDKKTITKADRPAHKDSQVLGRIAITGSERGPGREMLSAPSDAVSADSRDLASCQPGDQGRKQESCSEKAKRLVLSITPPSLRRSVCTCWWQICTKHHPTLHYQ